MWPPTTVVQEHKRRANFIWASLVMLIISYSLWLIISTYEKRKNPTVSISIKNDRYSFPTITICAFAGTYVGYGCDSADYSCVQDMYSSIHSPIGFENINGDIYTSNVAVLNEEYSSDCVDLDQSDMAEIANQSGLFPLRLVFWVEWFLNSGTDSDDTDDDETQIENSEGAYVFFTDPEISDPLGSHFMSTFVGVIPFTRQRAGDVPESFTQTAITMKLTESINLNGTDVKSYSAGTISSKDYLIPSFEAESSTQDRAVMLLEILQPSLTHTVRKEVDPLEWAELLGSIGGTWEILLIVWGIFFIARNSDEPELKGRDLVKTVQKGAENIARGAASIMSGVSNKRTLEDPSTSETKETVADWDILPTATSNHPGDHQARRPPPAYDFGGNQATNSSGGGNAQASRDTDYRSHSIEGLNHKPSHNIPTIDDLPRPMHRPF